MKVPNKILILTKESHEFGLHLESSHDGFDIYRTDNSMIWHLYSDTWFSRINGLTHGSNLILIQRGLLVSISDYPFKRFTNCSELESLLEDYL